MRSCKRIVIFEGPDGGGKSTAAHALADAAGARYVHCGPFPGVKDIGRLYLEAMAPALEGYQDVVMDRCWVSESIYGLVHRNGLDRLGVAGRRMLERVAMRCAAQVVLCLPPVGACLEAFRRRKGAEYLDSEAKLERVCGQYHRRRFVGDGLHRLTDLPTMLVDYTKGDQLNPVIEQVYDVTHDASWSSAGSRGAKVLIVGDTFADRKGADGLAQYPFVSFSRLGCSLWLTQHLEDCGIMEKDLLWVNAHEAGAAAVLAAHLNLPRVALGTLAFNRLQELEAIDTTIRVKVEHPQHAKRFVFRKTYNLIRTLKELIHA